MKVLILSMKFGIDTETGNYEIIEYNLDTSAGHPDKQDDDIVRHSGETQRIKDKEP